MVRAVVAFENERERTTDVQYTYSMYLPGIILTPAAKIHTYIHVMLCTLGNSTTKLTSCLVVRAGNDAGDQGYGNDAEANDLEQKGVREAFAPRDGLNKYI